MRYLQTKTVVGLDIEPTYVAAVEGRSGAVAVERAATIPVPPGVVGEGEVVDPPALAGLLRDLFAEHKLSRRVRLGVANQRIVMRTIDLPPLKDAKEIASAVRFQAPEHIPMPLDQAVLEHQVLGEVQTDEGPRCRVVVVAARREMIDGLLEVARQANLRPQGVDLSAFALIRALYRPERVGPTLYINLGGVTNLAIAADRVCLFTRVVGQGMQSIAGELAERLALTHEHARGWLAHVGLSEPVEEIEGDEAIVFDTRSVLTDGISRIAHEVRNSLDFHAMQAGVEPVAQAVVAGPAVGIPGVLDHLGVELGLPVEPGTVAGAAAIGRDSFGLAVAAGLTVEEAPE